MARCSCGDHSVHEHDLDVAFTLPEVVWHLSPEQRRKRALYDTSVCVLDDERFFIRGIAYVPVRGSQRGRFGWGLWIEVSEPCYERYRQMLLMDKDSDPPIEGNIANSIRGYGWLIGQRARLVFHGASIRPSLVLLPARTRLYFEQRDGVDWQEFRRTLVELGVLELRGAH